MNESAFRSVENWGESEKPFVRRAAAVSLIREEKNFIVYYDIQKVLQIAERLMGDKNLFHVRVEKLFGNLRAADAAGFDRLRVTNFNIGDIFQRQ